MDDKKLDILKTEFLLTQQQMDKYDQFSTTIKTWAVTLWVATSGWALQSGKKEMMFLSIVLILAFWFFDGINKTFRTNYKKRRDEIAMLLGKVFCGETIGVEESAPKLPLYSLKGLFKNSFFIHLSLPYIVFFVLSLVFIFMS
ncbi:MAG: hypothetical protein AB1333_04155 [Patescibacteria group bacterium]